MAVPDALSFPDVPGAQGAGAPAFVPSPARLAGLLRQPVFLAKLAISGASLWWVGHMVDARALGESLRTLSLPWLGASFVFFLLVALLGGLRWWVSLRAIGQAARVSTLTALFWIAMLVNQVLPAAAGDTLRVWLSVRGGYRLQPALNSIFLERVVMLLVLLAMVTATGPLTARLLHLASPEWWPLLFMLAGVAGLAALMLADRVASRFAHWRIIGFLAALSADTRRLAASRWTLPMLVLCALGNLNFVAAAWLLGQALGLALPFADYLAFMPLVVVVTVLPVSVGGWGLREGLLVALLAHVGIPAHNALAFSLLFGACSAVGSLPGLALWWLRAEPARVALA